MRRPALAALSPLAAWLLALAGCAAQPSATPSAPSASAARPEDRRALACAAPGPVPEAPTRDVWGAALDQPDGKTIRALRIEGATPPAGWEEALAPLKVGARLDADATDAALVRLQKLGSFEDVQLFAEGDGELDLTIKVGERPRLREVFVSPDSPQPGGDWGAPRPGVLYEPFALDRTIDELKARWREAGHLDPVVEVHARREGALVDLCLRLTPSPEWKVDRFEVPGLSLITQEELRARMEAGRNTPGGHLDEDGLAALREWLLARLNDMGALDARVEQPVIDRNEGAHRFTITMQVTEGKRYRVGKVAVKGKLAGTDAAYLDMLRLRQGDFFVLSAVREGIERVREGHRRLSGRDAELVPTVKPSPSAGTVDLTIELIPR